MGRMLHPGDQRAKALLQRFQLAVTQIHVLFEKRHTLGSLHRPDDIAMYDRAGVCATWPNPS
jgi:hypothetical protein